MKFFLLGRIFAADTWWKNGTFQLEYMNCVQLINCLKAVCYIHHVPCIFLPQLL